MSVPRTVIVVLNWNGRQDTLACLESLRAIEPGPHEILVVDNGSEDGSEEAIRSAYPELPFLQTGSNLGFAGGNNAGIAWALKRGADHVLLLNNDTLVEPDFLRHMLARAQADPQVGVVGASIAYADHPQRLWAYGGGRFDVSSGWVRHVQRPLPDAQLKTQGNRHFYVTGCTMMLRRELLEQVGSLDTSYFHFCEDVDLCVRAQAAGWKVVVAGDARLLHKVSATTRVSSPLFLYYNLRSRLSLVRRHGPPGSPQRLALAKLWLRLWRPALFSGLGVSGWAALRRAYRDYLQGVTGPAPEALQSPRRTRGGMIALLVLLSLLGTAAPQVMPARAQEEAPASAEFQVGGHAELELLLRGEAEPHPADFSDLLYAMAADSSLSQRVLGRAGTWGRPLTHQLLALLEQSEVKAKQSIEGLYTVRDHGPAPGERPPTWSDLRLQGLQLLQRFAPRDGVGRDARLLREIERDQISSSPERYSRPSWVAERLQLWLDWWYDVGMDEVFWQDPAQRPQITPLLQQLRSPLGEGGVALLDLVEPLADDELVSRALVSQMTPDLDRRLIAECIQIILLYQVNFNELGFPQRRWNPEQGRLVGHTAAELRAVPLNMLGRICAFLPSGANEAEVIESYARWWQRGHLQLRYYRDLGDAPDLSRWLSGWEQPADQGGLPMPTLLRQFYVAEGFRDLLLDQVDADDSQLVAELVSWLARDRADAVANGFIFAYRQAPLRPLPGEEGRMVGIPWENVQAMIRDMLRRITGDVGLPEQGVDEFTRNQFWFDWWRAHDREAVWYRGEAPIAGTPRFEMQRGTGG